MNQSHSPPPQSSARQLILASTSPRRIHLLREARYRFEIDPSNVDEEKYAPGNLPSERAMYLARAKADAVSLRRPDDIILGADTVVAFGDRIIGKPKDAADARAIIDLLGGTTHIVITGISVICRGENFTRHARAMSAVRMKVLTAIELDRYVESNLWQGKAGGYGIQDSNPIVQCIGGEVTNVIGLPMKLTAKMLAEAGVRAYGGSE